MNLRVKRLALFISCSTACLGSPYLAIAADSATASGVQTQTERARPSRDSTAPIITLNGGTKVSVLQYVDFNDLGARAVDDMDGRVPVFRQGQVNVTRLGSYILTYRATDRAGNTATVTRTVTVIKDTTPPSINLLGDSEVTLFQGSRFKDLGVSASDDSGVVRIYSTGRVNTHKLGEYVLTYTAIDRSGNISTITRTVKVIAPTPIDTTAPVITLNGAATIELNVGGTYTELSATAMDNLDGTVTVTTTGSVDTATAGTYTIIYTAKDVAGNTVTATRTVTVKPLPNVAPTANAGADQTVNEQTTVNLLGTGTDVDGTIDQYQWTQISGETVELSNPTQAQASFVAPDVSTDTELTFKLTVTDNKAATAEATVKITVKRVDSTKPVISLNGSSSIELTVGDTYTEAGATATDDVDASVTVTSTGSVDTTQTGTYTVVYSATDQAGNQADPVTRTIVVLPKIYSLNDTGVFTCGDLNNNLLACPVAGYPNQDAEYGRDFTDNDATDGELGFSFTKLDASGQALPDQTTDYTTTPWACVQDKVTGLVWEVKTNDGGWRDMHWKYSWYQPNSANGGLVGYPTPYGGDACDQAGSCNTSAYATRVNASNLCGFHDWRLPTTEELYGITSLQTQNLDSAYFPNTDLGYYYWGAETFAPAADLAWQIDRTSIQYMTKGQNSPVRLVRGQP